MTPEEKIEDIRARLAQATEGPWYVGRCDQGDATCPVMRDGRVVAEVSTWTARGFIDATFIAEARQDIPFLLAQLDAAKAQQAAQVKPGVFVHHTSTSIFAPSQEDREP